MARTPRKNKSGVYHSSEPIFDGMCHIYKRIKSGDIWQFRMYIRTDKQDYRCSLRTRDYESAKSKARQLAVKLSGMIDKDIKVFGMTLDTLVAEYLAYRMNDVTNGDIVIGRYGAIKSQLKNMTNIKGGDIKLSELDRDCMFDYAQERKLSAPGVQDVTLRNEQATINHMIGYAYRKSHVHFEKLNFKKIKIRRDDIGVRGTFTLSEYSDLIKFLRKYVSKKDCPDDTERYERLMIRDYVYASSNTAMRVGEMRQLTWGDITKLETHYDEPNPEQSVIDEEDYDATREIHLVHLTVRAETSKVRQRREIITRGGNYFKRLQKRTEFNEPHHLIFSLDGYTPLDIRKWMRHWANIIEGMGIKDHKMRKLEWYSLRHFGITMRVMAGVSLIDLSKIAGTSVTHIENTYLKYSDAQKKTAALKDFTINADGTLTLFDS
jgi:integrase